MLSTLSSISCRTTVRIIVRRYPNPYISFATFIVGGYIHVMLIMPNSFLRIALFILSFMSLASS